MRIPIKVQGECMMPFLASGTVVWVERADFYWPGDCLVFISKEGRLTVHRMIGAYPKKSRWVYLTQADQAHQPDGPLLNEHIIGKVCVNEQKPSHILFCHRLWALVRFSRFIIAATLWRNGKCVT